MGAPPLPTHPRVVFKRRSRKEETLEQNPQPLWVHVSEQRLRILSPL